MEDDIRGIAREALDNYFAVLTKTGYLNDRDTNKLLFLLFIDDFLDNFMGYVTQEDYNTLVRIINCLGQTDCIIPMFECKYDAQVVGTTLEDTPFRITEWVDLRDTQTFDLRLINRL